MFDFSFKRGDYIIHARKRKIKPMWKSSPMSQFTQSELQQIQQVLRDELKWRNLEIKVMPKSQYIRKLKVKVKKLSALQAKVKHLTNL